MSMPAMLRGGWRGIFTEPARVLAAILRFCILNWPNTSFGLFIRRQYMVFRAASVGRGLQMMRGCDINGLKSMHIGERSGIAENVVFAIGPGPNVFRMGSDTFIGPGCYVRNMNHRFDSLALPISQQGHEGTDIIIGDDVWIGARCILLAGTEIGDHCVVAAGSVLSSKIPSNSVVGGNPARVIKKRG